MRNLLSADSSRLRKSRVFWVCAAVLAALALWQGGMEFRVGPDQPVQDRWAGALFDEIYFELPGILAVFTGLFLGAEYDGGAIRNKMIVGRSRWMVYCSALLTTSSVAVLLALLYAGVTAALCRLAHGPMPDPSRVPVFLAAVLLVCLAWSALFTAVGLNCTRPAVSVVADLAIVGVMFEACQRVFFSHIIIHGDGPETALSALSRFFYDFLPIGQGDQLRTIASVASSDPPETLMLYSALFTALSTAVGLLLFHRKDLK